MTLTLGSWYLEKLHRNSLAEGWMCVVIGEYLGWIQVQHHDGVIVGTWAHKLRVNFSFDSHCTNTDPWTHRIGKQWVRVDYHPLFETSFEGQLSFCRRTC